MEDFRLIIANGLLSCVSEMNGVFKNKQYLPPLGVTKSNNNRLYVLIVSWKILTTDSKQGFLCLVFDGSLELAQMRRVNLNYICLIIHRITCIQIFEDKVNSMILYVFFSFYLCPLALKNSPIHNTQFDLFYTVIPLYHLLSFFFCIFLPREPRISHFRDQMTCTLLFPPLLHIHPCAVNGPLLLSFFLQFLKDICLHLRI